MTHLRGHLGPNVSAVVDGELDHNHRDRALSHVMRCPVCRAEVDAERAAKALLSRLGEPSPSTALLASLLSLPGPFGPLPPDRATFGGPRPAHAAWRPTTMPPGGPAHGSRRPGQPGVGGSRTAGRSDVSHRFQLFAAGAFSAVAVTLGLAALGSEQPAGPAPSTVVPPVADFTVEHSRTTTQLPFTGRSVVFEPVGTGTTLYSDTDASRP